MTVQGALQAIILITQALLDELQAREGIAGILYQGPQQVKFSRGEFHRLTVEHHFVAIQVHQQTRQL